MDYIRDYGVCAYCTAAILPRSKPLYHVIFFFSVFLGNPPTIFFFDGNGKIVAFSSPTVTTPLLFFFEGEKGVFDVIFSPFL